MIRNIPEETKTEDIENFLGRKNLPCRIESINLLRGEYFGLVTMESVDMCERACLLLNDRQINKKKLKAHIHPETCGRRNLAQVHEFLKPIFKEDEDLASANLSRLKSLLEDARLQEEVRKLEADLYKYKRHETFDRSRDYREHYRKDVSPKPYEKDFRRRESRERHYEKRDDRGEERRRSKDRHHPSKEVKREDRNEERKKDKKSPKSKKDEGSSSPKKEEHKSKEKTKEVSPKPEIPEAGEVKPKESKFKKEVSIPKVDGGSEKRKGKESSRHR